MDLNCPTDHVSGLQECRQANEAGAHAILVKDTVLQEQAALQRDADEVRRLQHSLLLVSCCIL